jgi:hypothetical protein
MVLDGRNSFAEHRFLVNLAGRTLGSTTASNSIHVSHSRCHSAPNDVTLGTDLAFLLGSPCVFSPLIHARQTRQKCVQVFIVPESFVPVSV